MTSPTLTSHSGRTSVPAPAASRTRTLLACGVAAGPLFMAVVLVQALTDSGSTPSCIR